MSAPSPIPQRHPFHLAEWLPSRRSMLWVLLAVIAGVVLFALATSGRDDTLPKDGMAAPAASSPTYEPLPTPLAGGRETASGMGKPPQIQADGDKPRLVETAPARPPEVAAAPKPVATTTVTRDPTPIPGQSPAPRYPSSALRRGESGTVTVRAEISADGIPTGVKVAGTSGSRQLDRAAMDAVRRWRFTPAMRHGEPTPGTVVVPISFEARR